MNSYTKIYEKVPTDNKCIAQSIINELEFMQKTLDDLKEDVNQNGALDHYVNGKQDCMRESPALKGYNSLIQRYTQLNKQLLSLVPHEDTAPKSDLMNFIEG